jgi:hypothetical protein
VLALVLLHLAVLAGAAGAGARGSPWTDWACLGVLLCFVGLCSDLDRKT